MSMDVFFFLRCMPSGRWAFFVVVVVVVVVVVFLHHM
jgi:hypothetical protein